MSDNRRRRKSQQSDDLSDSYEELNTTKESQNSEHTDQHDSEYDTAGSESDTESQDRAQRESGDGQEEEKPAKKLNHDEDRRNPQYIPRRGTFYEHDDRTADEVNDETTQAQPEREVKEKKVWKDKEDKWDHDRYNDEEQAPKSHAELIAVYGYDIRNEEGPPRARRRRKYGRGPNKYTRNWEDQDAYGKVAASVPPHKINPKKVNRTGEDFPSLNPQDNDAITKPEEKPVITSAWYSNKNKIHTNKTQNYPPLQQTENQKTKTKQFTNSQANENKAPNDRNNSAWKREIKNTSYIQNSNETNAASGDSEKVVIVKTIPRETKRPPQVQESVSLAANKSRGRGFKANPNNNIIGSRTIESKPKGRGPGPMNIDNRRSNVEHEQVVNDMKHMNVSTEGSMYHHAARQNKHFYTQPSSQQHSTVVPPRMQPNHPQQQAPPPQQQQPPQPPPQQDITSNRPKRYSSLRQRPPITDGPPTPAQPTYPPAPQHTYYPPPQAGSSRAVLESPGYAPSPYEPSPPVPAPAASMAGQPVIPIPPGPQPTSYAPHAPPPFLVPPPQFIPSQTAPPSIINYVAGPNGPIFQPNYQGYNPAAVQPGPPPPQDVGMYQPQGCTYYSPAQQQQQQQQQPVPLRRPKAAIPILPPPDNLQAPNNRTRIRSSQPPQSQSQDQQMQQHQIQQQQQQQEQLVQQQLQQHQQQLIQEQQQELQQQQEQLIQQQQKIQLQQQQQKLQQMQQMQLIQQQELQKQQQEMHHQQQQKELLQQQQQKELEQKQKELEEQHKRELEEQQQQAQSQSGSDKQHEAELQTEEHKELAEKQQQQSEEERQKQLQEQQQKELEQQKQKALEEQKQKDLEEQKQKDLEEQKQKDLEEQKQREVEAQKKKELEEQRLKELEEQRQKESEVQKQKELEQQKEKELEEQRLKKLEEQQQKELEELRQKELEEQRQKELEEHRQKEIEEQRLKELEQQRQKELEEQRQKELEKQEQQKKTDENSDKISTEIVEKIIIKSISEAEPKEDESSEILTNTKIDLEEQLEKVTSQATPELLNKENAAEIVVLESETEKKDIHTNVEVNTPNLEKTLIIKEGPLIVDTEVDKGKIDLLESKCIVEGSIIINAEKIEELATKTAELISGKTETDCSIKESAVIEEAAA